jgi:hypothetical protein
VNVATLNCQLEKALESFEAAIYRCTLDRAISPVFQRLFASEIPVLANDVTRNVCEYSAAEELHELPFAVFERSLGVV